jgi:hypothetical protein
MSSCSEIKVYSQYAEVGNKRGSMVYFRQRGQAAAWLMGLQDGKGASAVSIGVFCKGYSFETRNVTFEIRWVPPNSGEIACNGPWS